MKKFNGTQYKAYMAVLSDRINSRNELILSAKKDDQLIKLSFEDWCLYQNGELVFDENQILVPVIKKLTEQEQFFKDISDTNPLFKQFLDNDDIFGALYHFFSYKKETLGDNCPYEVEDDYEERSEDTDGYYHNFVFLRKSDGKFVEISTYEGRKDEIEGPDEVKRVQVTKWK